MSEIALTPDLIHYAKEVDKRGRFIRWVSNPKAMTYKERCEALIAEASQYKSDNFTDSVTIFFENRGFLSRKQYGALRKNIDKKEANKEIL